MAHTDFTPMPWPEEGLQPARIEAKLQRSAHPYISLKAAVSLDGKIATAGGESQWITGPAARRHGHGLRACHDGILVGIATVLHDDPLLTARLPGVPRSPVRVVLDSTCRIPPAARCLAADGVRRIVVVGRAAHPSRIEVLQGAGVEVLRCDDARPAPAQFLPLLRACGVQRLLIEGGSAVHANMIAQGQPDELFLYLAGKIVGGPDALGWCEELEVHRLADAPALRLSRPLLVGEDVLIHGVFARPS